MIKKECSKSTLMIFLLFQILFLALLPLLMELTSYLHQIVLVVVWFCYSTLVLFSLCLVKNEVVRISQKLFQLIIGLYSISLLILLFFRPANQNYDNINLIPFETVGFYLFGEVHFLISFYNLAANIGLFIPFGIYYRYVKKNPHFFQLLFFSVVAIAGIEGLQFLSKRGTLDVDDLLLNMLGVCIGYFFFPLIRKVLVVTPNEHGSLRGHPS